MAGFDLSGNAGDSVLRSELLYRASQAEGDFVKYAVNVDYNLPYNIYSLIEYHYNGEGKSQPADYQWPRLFEGEITQLARDYLGLMFGHDLTPLVRVELRAIWNLNDRSLFFRPELHYEPQTNVLLTLGTLLFSGAAEDEFGAPHNVYFAEVKYSF